VKIKQNEAEEIGKRKRLHKIYLSVIGVLSVLLAVAILT